MNTKLRFFRVSFLFLASLYVAGCVGKPPLTIDRYLIAYPAPVLEKLPRIEDALRVDRFSVADAYNSEAMIFRSDSVKFDSLNYNKWAVNPADMATDNLLRDLQESGLFRAVFSRYVLDEGRYVLQGGIHEFFLRMDKAGNAAVIKLEITLKDITQREATRRILFQKKYQEEELPATRTPEGYAKAMSRALERISRKITNDIYKTLAPAQAGTR
ncbi:MAG: membrane integrity-associated transporter subunit PqiC [Syntrophobacterales bacterium]|nr:membrane integrity-associated transporter subunit PqiC [Syntrophobacterales bacterium]